MDNIQKSQIRTSKTINVKLSEKIKQIMGSHGKTVAAGAAVISGVVFMSANYLSPISDIEDKPSSHSQVLPTDELCNNEGSYLQAECMDIPTCEDIEGMTFADVFASQRDALGAGGIFEYNGKLYNTYLKEEWESLTDIDKNTYYSKVGMDINVDDAKIIISDEAGSLATLSYDSETIMSIQVIDTDNDGIVDIASIDVNFDGIADYQFEIEREVIVPSEDVEMIDDNIIIDGSYDQTIVPEIDIVDVESDDLVPVDDDNVEHMKQDNLFDEEIDDYDLPEMIDDMDMGEFNL